MIRVWEELQRRKRLNYLRTDDFVNSASEPGRQSFWTDEAKQTVRHLRPGADDRLLTLHARMREIGLREKLLPWRSPPIPLQEFALAFFFHELVRLAMNQPQLIPLQDAQRLQLSYQKEAKQLQTDADKFERQGMFGCDRLRAAANAYEEIANATIVSPLVTLRKPRSSATWKGFVIALADVNKGIFGRPLLGTVATVGNVVFNRDDLSGAKVDKMLRTYPR
jgi:hypothetical protein